MLIKEYRIPLPLTVEEYRIAQLYMIAKKSRDESHGQESGVEIIINEPYKNGPGGDGQYTKKLYHVGSHLPGWIKSLLPKSALTVEEEAWNAYPFTKTRYTCPFVEKFSLDIETYYTPDNGYQENIFKLSGGDLRNRVVDVIDIVKDQLYGGDYVRDEDPTLYVSEKTLRGPLDVNWLEYYWNEVKGKTQPTVKNMSLMCAYKLCRVEFRYWGMQTKLEKFIHDVALRKTMLRAHRQAWAWQDEWVGLTMDDIREFERQTQLALAKKMGVDSSDDEEENDVNEDKQNNSEQKIDVNDSQYKKHSAPSLIEPPHDEISSSEEEDEKQNNRGSNQLSSHSKYVSKNLQHSPANSAHSFDMQAVSWRMERLEIDSKSGSEEEFFDCLDTNESNSLAKWSSLELLTEEDDSHQNNQLDDSIFSPEYLQKVAAECVNKHQTDHLSNVDKRNETPPGSPNAQPCLTSVLILVFHAGSILDATSDISSKKSDVNTLRAAFESVMRQHYPSLLNHVVIKLVPCPAICSDALGILSSLSPYSFDASPFSSELPNIVDLPSGAIPLLMTSSPKFQDDLNRTITASNAIYKDFLKSEEGIGFQGQVVLIADSVGSILAYEALCRYQRQNDEDDEKVTADTDLETKKNLSVPPTRRRLVTSGIENRLSKLEFVVSDFFMFGSSLSIVLASKILHNPKHILCRPSCTHIYNMFHPTDPTATRLEPLLSARFSSLPPVNVPRHAKYPLGNGQPLHLLEIIQSHPHHFNENGNHHNQRRLSDESVLSCASGLTERVSLHLIQSLQKKWWGTKRLDYALYCPDGLSNFPSHALPHLFHASYWESSDVIAFILRQIGKFESLNMNGSDDNATSTFKPGQPREKWIRKRTSVKIKNVAPNHRGNDIIVLEGQDQILAARFMYGPLDMFTLAGEKVDIHIMKDPPSGEWTLFSTEITDKNGRIQYVVPYEKALGYGIYPIKMIVRGDHTSVDFYMAVIPMKTECVVFSIDGSFTASMSVTGRDPKVRAGAVDVCRHWQELGYLLIYITGRPDLQQQRVVSWLSQHNFPHGLISFADGLSTDPLGHKTAFLNNLILNHGVSINAAYGSCKDISVYTNIGLRPNQIYIVGKVSKKLQQNAVVLNEGYASHLSKLMAVGGSRPAQGNARMVIPRACFNLPGQTSNSRKMSNEVEKSSSPLCSGYLKRKMFLSHP